MAARGRAILFGFLDWLAVFVVAFLILADIGLTYLVIPTVTIAMGAVGRQVAAAVGPAAVRPLRWWPSSIERDPCRARGARGAGGGSGFILVHSGDSKVHPSWEHPLWRSP